MSYGTAEATLEPSRGDRDATLKFSWQSTQRPATDDTPTDYIVHKMRTTLRPEMRVAPQELRAIRFIEVFLFLVFFPLGFALNRYNQVFGSSIAMSVLLFATWWGVVLSLIYLVP